MLSYPFYRRRASTLLPLSALAVLFAGCGAAPEDPSGAAGEAITVCPAGAVVQGVDVSVFQGNINWPAVKGAGIDFAIARVSDGSFMDTQFDANWPGMKSAGLVRGVYQFFEPGEDPTTQANIVINKVGVLGAGDLPATLDVEVTGNQSPGTIAANIKTWADKITTGTGKAPMIYTAPGFWNGSVQSSNFGYLPLWGANWGPACPDLAEGWTSWRVWQYSDSGSVSGIPATVDLDEYNGSLAQLQAYAGQSADWGAQYVSQSFPLATTALVMTVNQTIPAYIELKNIGAKSWDASTKIGTTQPRDRASIFVAPDWLAPNRLAKASGTIAPGQSFKFQFDFHAPDKPGTYEEFFGVVQEGVHWFSDPGQAGPPDNDLEAKIQIVNAQYYGQYVSQSYPTLQQPAAQLVTGQPVDGWIELKNVGTATWKAGVTKLAPTPRDKPSAIAGTTWLSATRVSTVMADVPPGSSAKFPLQLEAAAPGHYTQTFSLVEEAVTWFADAPKGGGPPDDLLAVHVIVSDAPDGGAGGAGGGGGSAGAAGTATGPGATTGTTTGTGTGKTSGTGPSGGPSGAGGGSANGGTGGGAGSGALNPGVTGGCGCHAAGQRDAGSGGPAAWLLAVGALVVGSRRGRRD